MPGSVPSLGSLPSPVLLPDSLTQALVLISLLHKNPYPRVACWEKGVEGQAGGEAAVPSRESRWWPGPGHGMRWKRDPSQEYSGSEADKTWGLIFSSSRWTGLQESLQATQDLRTWGLHFPPSSPPSYHSSPRSEDGARQRFSLPLATAVLPALTSRWQPKIEREGWQGPQRPPSSRERCA